MSAMNETMSEKLSFRDIILKLFTMRRVMYSEEDIAEEGGSSPSFRELLKWMKSSQSAKEESAMKDLFENLGATPFEEEGFRLLDTRYYDQCYRVISCLRSESPVDIRPWEYAQMLPDKYFKMYTFTSSLIMQLKKTTVRSKSGFYTVQSTSFERLMYLIATKRLLNMREQMKGRRSRASGTNTGRSTSYRSRSKRRKTEASNEAEIKTTVFTIDRENTSRLGYAVQTVIRSWDMFSRSLGFDNTDAMIAPYIIFDEEEMSFKCIRTREEGFAPKGTVKSIIGELKATLDETNCDQAAFRRQEDVDKSLRALTSLFLEDIFSITTSDLIYSGRSGHEHELLKSLENLSGAIPERFTDMPPNTRDAINALSKPEGEAEDDKVQAAFPSVVCRDKVPTATGAKRRPSGARAIIQARPKKSKPLMVIQCSKGEGCVCHGARERLGTELEKYARLYTCSYDELPDVDSSSCPSGGLDETGQLFLTDPPFNYRRLNEKTNSDHDNITEDEMREVSKLAHSILQRGGHAIIFCSPLQFHLWYGYMSSQDFDPEFKVDSSPLTLVNRPGHYFGAVSRKKTALHPITSWALHATKSGLSLQENFDLVDYTNHNHVPSRHAAWTNTIDEVGRLTKGEHLRGTTEEGGTKNLFRPEQKSLAVMKEIICRFSRKGAEVIDTFAGTGTTACAALSLPDHRKFVGCDIMPDVVKAAKERLIEVLANSLLDKFCDITTDSRELLEDARLVHSHSTAVMKPDPDWYQPDGYPGFQTLPSYHTMYLSALWKRPDFCSTHCNKSVSEWPSSMKGALQCADPAALLAVECSHIKTCVARSNIRHDDAGEGLFAMKNFTKNETIGYYYGVLVYVDIYNRRQVTKTYGEDGLLGATVNEFKTYALRIPVVEGGIKVRETRITEAFVVPKKFCACAKINEPSYRAGDKDEAEAELGDCSRREANVQFICSPVQTLSQLKAYTAVQVRATRNISAGEELYVNYRETSTKKREHM